MNNGELIMFSLEDAVSHKYRLTLRPSDINIPKASYCGSLEKSKNDGDDSGYSIFLEIWEINNDRIIQPACRMVIDGRTVNFKIDTDNNDTIEKIESYIDGIYKSMKHAKTQETEFSKASERILSRVRDITTHALDKNPYDINSDDIRFTLIDQIEFEIIHLYKSPSIFNELLKNIGLYEKTIGMTSIKDLFAQIGSKLENVLVPEIQDIMERADENSHTLKTG